MDDTLKLRLLNSLFRLRKTAVMFPTILDVHMRELIFLRKIAEHAVNAEVSVAISHLHHKLHISKPAVSHILRSLEAKGYLTRDIDLDDRRKIMVSLTTKGCEVMHRMDEHMDAMLDAIITQMGEEEARQFVTLLARFIDILQSQACTDLHKGEESL